MRCVSQAEAVEAWDGLPASLQMEVASPQAWLCEAPRRLVVSQRMSGAPKIWTLPRAKLDPLASGLKVTTHALGTRREEKGFHWAGQLAVMGKQPIIECIWHLSQRHHVAALKLSVDVVGS